MASSVSILMATLCTSTRRQSIERALDSVLTQQGVDVRPVIVINGERFDANLKENLEKRPELRVKYQRKADLFAARRLARESVETDYFCWLDDDDVYLPGGLQKRVNLAEADRSIDVVVSNGYIWDGCRDSRAFEDVAEIREDPVGTLLTDNWLCAAGGLYRTGSISPDYLDVTIRSLDMTYLAFRLAIEKTIAFLDEPTFRKHVNPGSLSSTHAWMLPAADVLRRMMKPPIGPYHKRLLRRKLSNMEHEIAEYYMESGAIQQAWTHHLSSLLQGQGAVRYALFTRKLVVSSAAQFFGQRG